MPPPGGIPVAGTEAMILLALATHLRTFLGDVIVYRAVALRVATLFSTATLGIGLTFVPRESCWTLAGTVSLHSPSILTKHSWAGIGAVSTGDWTPQHPRHTSGLHLFLAVVLA